MNRDNDANRNSLPDLRWIRKDGEKVLQQRVFNPAKGRIWVDVPEVDENGVALPIESTSEAMPGPAGQQPDWPPKS